MLHGTIRNDDDQRNPSLQCWNNIGVIQTNVATRLQRCVAPKIVVANRLVWHHFNLEVIIFNTFPNQVTYQRIDIFVSRYRTLLEAVGIHSALSINFACSKYHHLPTPFQRKKNLKKLLLRHRSEKLKRVNLLHLHNQRSVPILAVLIPSLLRSRDKIGPDTKSLSLC